MGERKHKGTREGDKEQKKERKIKQRKIKHQENKEYFLGWIYDGCTTINRI